MATYLVTNIDEAHPGIRTRRYVYSSTESCSLWCYRTRYCWWWLVRSKEVLRVMILFWYCSFRLLSPARIRFIPCSSVAICRTATSVFPPPDSISGIIYYRHDVLVNFKTAGLPEPSIIHPRSTHPHTSAHSSNLGPRACSFPNGWKLFSDWLSCHVSSMVCVELFFSRILKRIYKGLATSRAIGSELCAIRMILVRSMMISYDQVPVVFIKIEKPQL